MSYTKNASISVEGRTIQLKPHESMQINVRFNDMEPCPLVYEVPSDSFGSVTKDGFYTAPEREGSYEVRITCPTEPLAVAYAYISVSK